MSVAKSERVESEDGTNNGERFGWVGTTFDILLVSPVTPSGVYGLCGSWYRTRAAQLGSRPADLWINRCETSPAKPVSFSKRG